MTQRLTFEEVRSMLGDNSKKLAQSSILLAMRRKNGRQFEEADTIVSEYVNGKFGLSEFDTKWAEGLKYKNGMSPEKKLVLMLGRKGSDVRDGGQVGISSRALDTNEEAVQKEMVANYIGKDAEFIVQVNRNIGKAEQRIQKRDISQKDLGEAGKKASEKKEPTAAKKTAKASEKKEPSKKPVAKRAAKSPTKRTAAKEQEDMAAKRAAKAATTSPGRSA